MAINEMTVVVLTRRSIQMDFHGAAVEVVEVSAGEMEGFFAVEVHQAKEEIGVVVEVGLVETQEEEEVDLDRSRIIIVEQEEVDAGALLGEDAEASVDVDPLSKNYCRT